MHDMLNDKRTDTVGAITECGRHVLCINEREASLALVNHDDPLLNRLRHEEFFITPTVSRLVKAGV